MYGIVNSEILSSLYDFKSVVKAQNCATSYIAFLLYFFTIRMKFEEQLREIQMYD